MKRNRISKNTYRAIYRLLNMVSPVDDDCGRLCGSACCTSGEEDMGIYLLPGEEALWEDNRDWFDWSFQSPEECALPGILDRTRGLYPMQDTSCLQTGRTPYPVPYLSFDALSHRRRRSGNDLRRPGTALPLSTHRTRNPSQRQLRKSHPHCLETPPSRSPHLRPRMGGFRRTPEDDAVILKFPGTINKIK